MSAPRYRGRFAPSPTGPLHLGSLVAALGSWLDARARGGEWLLRMEDLDPPREVAGAAAAILATLDALGLHWDGPVLHQSTRAQAYDAALARLKEGGLVFPCACTRSEVARGAPGVDGPVYPGTCRSGLPAGRRARALRARVPDAAVGFDDAVQGRLSQNLAREVGDFVLRRADGLTAYQLAVVVDDAFQGVTQVVRGADLLDSTPRQVWLQQALGLPTPGYAHLPVVVNGEGQKLSKQTLAPPLDPARPGPALHASLALLGQAPPGELARAQAPEILAWAQANWRLDAVPRRRTVDEPWVDVSGEG